MIQLVVHIARYTGLLVLGLALNWLCFCPIAIGYENNATACDESGVAPGTLDSHHAEVLRRFCVSCHSDEDPAGEFNLNRMIDQPVTENSDPWEQVIRKLTARQMPPLEATRPDEATYDALIRCLQTPLDLLAAKQPRPGRTDSIRRLTRTEYQNAIRDLLLVEIDADSLLPADESSHGFDNITVGELSPTLLNRYVMAAQKVARVAVGGLSREPTGETFRVRPDLTQETHVTGLPLGTRGGALINYNFVQDGQYHVQVRLSRDRNEHVEGLRGQHELVVLLDRFEIGRFTIRPPQGGQDHSQVDAHLQLQFEASAGPHQLGVTFVRKSASLLETERQPYQARFNMHRHPRTSPAVYQVSIVGPFEASGAGDSPSRRRLFEAVNSTSDSPDEVAQKILMDLMQRAYRRPVLEAELALPMQLFRQSLQELNFDAGLESAVAAVLVNPNFLFRIERDPKHAVSGQAYMISDVELASRLSFFLWSSIPDDELLALALQNKLSQPSMLDAQVARMLADPRAEALVNNFADQWLYLRNLNSVFPDMRKFPDFDDNLRQAMRKETELFFQHIMREDLSVVDLLCADYTFLNERLAKHYGISHVYGDRFRRVELSADAHRGGLLRHASILTVTSYATRTSPVIRGHWILKNLIGSPPPPPPADVPALKDNTVLDSLPIRERLQQHRADPNCAGCHNLMDPVGFSLENFDAVGRWRERDDQHLVDALGGLPDGSQFAGVDGLEQGLMKRPELFVGTLTEKLLTYAVGRGVENYDAAAVRQIVREAADSEYRFSSLIQGIVRSTPFQMRTAE